MEKILLDIAGHYFKEDIKFDYIYNTDLGVEDYIRKLHANDEGRIFFIHTSDSIWQDPPLDEHFVPGKIEDMLEYLISNCINNNHRAILFSGGSTNYKSPNPVEKVFDNLRRLPEILEHKHWLACSTDDLNTKLDWKKCSETNITNDFSIKSLFLNQDGKNLLIEDILTLDILLQGYLAIRKPETIFGDNPNDFMSQNHILQTESLVANANSVTQFCLPLTDETQRVFRPGEEYPYTESVEFKRDPQGPKQQGWYWFDECLPDIEKHSWSEMCRKNPYLDDCKSLKKIWMILKGTCLGKEDWIQTEKISQDKLTEIIAEAHAEFSELTTEDEKKNEADSLENIRSILNHNRIKNQFINKLTSSPGSPFKERISDIKEVLRYKHNTQGNDFPSNISSKLSSIEAAFSAWEEIKEEITDFFEEKIKKYGFQLTEKGENAKNKILQNDDACINKIDSFVGEFDDLAKEDTKKHITELKLLIEASDELYDILHEMKNFEDSQELFGGYLQEAEEE